MAPRWGEPTCCDFPTWLDITKQSKLHMFWQPPTPLRCACCESASCTPRFKCRVSHEFTSIKWVCITMGPQLNNMHESKYWRKMAIGLTMTYIIQCWLLKVDKKLCLHHDYGVSLSPP
jgi:hypothetical protein